MDTTDEQLRKAVDAVFSKYDQDRNGTLQAQEVGNLINDALKQMHQTRKVNQSQVQQFMGAVDTNKDRRINKDQLLKVFKKVVIFK